MEGRRQIRGHRGLRIALLADGIGKEDAASREEERELVRKSIDQLPENYRNVLLLRDIEGIDTGETAQLLGLTPGAVKTRLHRARLALRQLLDPYFHEVNHG